MDRGEGMALVTQLVTLAPCVSCNSRAVASGFDKRGRRVVVCSACGKRALAPDSMQPRRTPPPSPIKKPYWIDD